MSVQDAKFHKYSIWREMREFKTIIMYFSQIQNNDNIVEQ